MNKAQYIRNRGTKLRAIKYLGGKCVECDLNLIESHWCAEWHHKDQSQKDFIVSRYFNLSWNTIKDEISKCELMCRNCHNKTHFNLDQYNEFKTEIELYSEMEVNDNTKLISIKKPTYLTEEQQEEIIQSYNKVDARSLAVKYDIHEQTVRKIWNRNKIVKDRWNRKITNEKLIELNSNGLNSHELARHFNCTEKTVKRRLKDLGLKSPSNQGQKFRPSKINW